jgi:hypothetical protein
MTQNGWIPLLPILHSTETKIRDISDCGMIRSLLNMDLRRGCTLVLCGTTLVVSCTNAPPTPPQVPPVALPTSSNGNYRGFMQLASGPAMSCGTQVELTLHVRNNAFEYVLPQPQVPLTPQRAFQVVIASDGSFQAQSGPAFIRGQVSQGHMQGQIYGDLCGYQFEADSTGTF